MFTGMSDLTKAAWFYGIAVALAFGVLAAPFPHGATGAIYMFTPMLAVLLMLLVVTRDGYSRPAWSRLGLGRAGFNRWPFALFVPLGVIGSAYVILWSSGLASIDRSANLGNVPVNIVISIIIMSVTFSMGEEIGWRGYLVPLIQTLGKGRAMVLSGMMHAAWHFPIIFLASGHFLTDGSRWVVVPLVTLTLVSAGVLYGYLRFTTESVWPAAIAHSAHNSITNALAGITIATPLTAAYWLSEGGFLLPLGYSLVALVIVATYLRSPARKLAPVPS